MIFIVKYDFVLLECKRKEVKKSQLYEVDGFHMSEVCSTIKYVFIFYYITIICFRMWVHHKSYVFFIKLRINYCLSF